MSDVAQVQVHAQQQFAGQELVFKNVHSEKALCTKHYSHDAESQNDNEPIIQFDIPEIVPTNGGYNLRAATYGKS